LIYTPPSPSSPVKAMAASAWRLDQYGVGLNREHDRVIDAPCRAQADRLAKGSGQLNSSSEAQPFDMAILAQFMAKR
jgi:hypothetical protein